MGGMDGPGAGKILATGNHQKGKRLQSMKLGRCSDRRGVDNEEVRELSRNLERVLLVSAPYGVRWGGVCEKPQHMRQGYQMRTYNVQKNSKGPDNSQGIRLASLNIRTVRAEGLKTSLHEIQQGNANVRFLQETKLMQGIHNRFVVGYNTWAI